MDTQPTTTALFQIETARHALALAKTFGEVKDLRDKAEAIRVYLRQRDGSLEAQNHAAELKIRAERRLGQLLAETVNHRGGRPEKRSHDATVSNGQIPDGVSKTQSSRWQKIAHIDDDAFERHIATAKKKGEELTTAGVMRIANTHVGHNSGEHEWYTPLEYLDAARTVLGEIDLDPASSEIAQQRVQAAAFYTTDDNGLEKPWTGRIWMNPPYAAELVKMFITKLVGHYRVKDVVAAVVLVNNSTETTWFRCCAEAASAICFPTGRVRFLDPDSRPGAPLQGQAVIYLGDDSERFMEVFGSFGFCVTVKVTDKLTCVAHNTARGE